jgi:hypothetical protein
MATINDNRQSRLAHLLSWGSCLGLLAAALPMTCLADTEMEADPLAYLEHGYSLHAAETVGADERFQLGLFALNVPGVALANRDFSVRYQRGMTLKFDRFPAGDIGGFFYGLDVNHSTARYRLDATGHTAYRGETGIGPRVGYRFDCGEHFYITPWISLSYLTRPEDITIDGQEYKEPRFSLFPTVHFGWRFGS